MIYLFNLAKNITPQTLKNKKLYTMYLSIHVQMFHHKNLLSHITKQNGSSNEIHRREKNLS